MPRLSTVSGAARTKGWRHAAAQERDYARVVSDAAKRASTRFQTFTAAGDWTIPDPDEILPLDELQEDFARVGEKRYRRVVKDVAGSILASYGLTFDESNPLMQGVFAQYGQRITLVSQTTRQDIMDVLQSAYHEGASIDDTARAIRDRAGLQTFAPPAEGDAAARRQRRVEHASALARGRVIARTEMTAAVNAGSLAAVRITGAAQSKTWLSAHDARTRRDHADANGQTVPISQPFDVGGWSMQYPGDPSAPAEEVCNCRCTTTWSDAPEEG